MHDADASSTILLTIDALRADHLSQYGYERETMPALDQLDNCGTRFASAFANGTNTGASLPSILSSRYDGAQSCINGPTIATILQNEGIKTAGFHSNTLFADIVGRADGFDDFQDFGVTEEQSLSDRSSPARRIYTKCADKIKPAVEQIGMKPIAKRIRDRLLPEEALHTMTYYVNGEETTDSVISWLHDHSDEPFFLWIHYLDPHRPYGIDLENPTFCDPINETEIRELMSKAGVNPSMISSSERSLMIDLYDSDLRYTSNAIKRLFDELKRLSIWDDTAVICTSDHGEEFGEHGGYFHRNLPYDELLHVPLFVKSANYDNEVVAEPKELIDIPPTICEIMGADAHRTFQGDSLSRSNERQVIATGSFAESGPVVAGRWDGWKYIETDNGMELYNIEKDPSEQDNIVERSSDLISHYRNEIPDDLFNESQVSTEQSENKAVQERLRGLGYLE